MCHCDAQNVPLPHSQGVPLDAPDGHVGDAGKLAKVATDAGTAGELDHTGVTNAGELDHEHPHVGREAGVALARQKRQRATQDTPPAIRREVFWRDRGRCVVPGCRNATYVDLHHLDLRSEGGSNDPDNLVVLCSAHHGALHRGRLRIDGKVSTGLRVRHADGTAYGLMPSPLLAAASGRAFAGLRRLGFSEKMAPTAPIKGSARTVGSSSDLRR
jgi:hypothetical protein